MSCCIIAKAESIKFNRSEAGYDVCEASSMNFRKKLEGWLNDDAPYYAEYYDVD
jgi:hypothetical protein